MHPAYRHLKIGRNFDNKLLFKSRLPLDLRKGWKNQFLECPSLCIKVPSDLFSIYMFIFIDRYAENAYRSLSMLHQHVDFNCV